MMRFIRFRQVVIFLLSGLLFSSALVLAQDDEILILDEEKPATPAATNPEISLPPEKEPEAVSTNYQTFYDKWQSYVQAVQSGNVVAAQNAVTAILELQKKQSIPKLTELALSAIRMGQSKLDEKDPASAMQYFGIAIQLDPTLPSAYYHQAIASQKRGISGIGTAVVAGVQGFLAPRKHLRGRVYFHSKMVFLLIATLALAAAGFALVLLIKYNHLLHHDAEEKYSQRAGPAMIRLAVWIVLFAPVVLFLGALWLAPYWLMIFIRYARMPEKIAAIALIPVFIFAGPAFHKAVYDASLLQDSATAAFYTAFQEGPSPRAIQDLQAYLSAHPDDWDSAVLLASLYEKNQMMDQALDLLQKLMTASPQDARPPNNLASIYFSRGELDYALRLAQKAANLDPSNAAYKFNLSNIYRAKFDFNEATTFMNEARATNPALVEDLERTSHEKVVNVVPTPQLLEKRLRGQARGFATFLLDPFSMLGGLLLLGAILRITINKKKVIAKECFKCGKAFCKKCQPDVKVAGFCIQCLHIFVRKDGVSPASRKEKMEEIESYSKRQRVFSRIASFILPGAGKLLQNRTLPGLATLLVWFFLVSVAGFTYRYAGSYFFEPSESARIIPLFCFVFMAAIYLATNLSLPRKTKAT